MARTTPPSRPFVLGFACGRPALTATPHTRLPKTGRNHQKTASTHPDQRLDRPRSYMDEPTVSEGGLGPESVAPLLRPWSSSAGCVRRGIAPCSCDVVGVGQRRPG